MTQSRKNMIIDRFFLILIIIMLAISTIIDTLGNQKLERAVYNADLIARCLDPKSKCAELTRKLNEKEREYSETFIKTTNICVLYVGREYSNGSVEEIAAAYDTCVEAGTPPAPPIAPSPPPPSGADDETN